MTTYEIIDETFIFYIGEAGMEFPLSEMIEELESSTNHQIQEKIEKIQTKINNIEKLLNDE